MSGSTADYDLHDPPKPGHIMPVDEESQTQKFQQLPLVPVAFDSKLMVQGRIIYPEGPVATVVQADNTSSDLPLLIWLLIATLVYAFLFLPSLTLCLMTVMMFDSGVITLPSLIMAGVIWCIPFLIAWAGVSMWKAYNRREYRLVLILSAIPNIILVMYLIVFLLYH